MGRCWARQKHDIALALDNEMNAAVHARRRLWCTYGKLGIFREAGVCERSRQHLFRTFEPRSASFGAQSAPACRDTHLGAATTYEE